MCCRKSAKAAWSSKGKLAPAAVNNAEYRAGELPGLAVHQGVKVLDSALFKGMYDTAAAHKRGRKMVDLTRDPGTNNLQKMVGSLSYSSVYRVFTIT